MGIKSNDIDYVVVGSTVEDMINSGFIPVGRDFPVFLHPKTHAQYALARTEKKSGVGYHGFQFYTSPDITLEQDLKRRDITINAIAEDDSGNLIDPFNGINDLKLKTIRHISDAFVEDPLRVLRVARFRAKLGFKIARKTLSLMRDIVASGELAYITQERIWGEISSALATHNPLLFFTTLAQSGALAQVLPEIQLAISDKKTYSVIKRKLSMHNIKILNTNQRFATICGCLCLFGHSKIAAELNNKAILGRKSAELSRLIIRFNHAVLNLYSLTATEILDLLERLDIQRKPERFRDFSQILQLIFSNTNKKIIRKHIQKIINIHDQFSQIDYANISRGLTHNQFFK